jgi:predicted Zn-dependent protease
MDPTRLAEYRTALSAIPEPLKLAEQNLQALTGKELSIQYMGKDRTIIPRRAENGELEADFVAADSRRLVVLKLSKFTAEELLKLLPAQPDSPAAHAAVCLTLLKANRKEDATAHARACGVLAPLFEAAAAAQP